MELKAQLEAKLKRPDGKLDFDATRQALLDAQPDVPAVIAIQSIVVDALKKYDAGHPITVKFRMQDAPVSDLPLQDYYPDGVKYCVASSMFDSIEVHFDAGSWDHAMHWGSHRFACESVDSSVGPKGAGTQIYYDHPGDPEVRGNANDYVSAVLEDVFGMMPE